ncbi:MAG: type IV pilus secretin PilQ [Nitrospiraceae bacterium]|nr:MAG: type IV pilus secretin PilQ [Nitrospiraceae bacterium]
MTRKKFLVFFMFIFLSSFFMYAGGLSEALQAGGSEITGISVQEVQKNTEIQIDSNAPFSYTIYKPADPYRLVVELQDVTLGKFTDNILVDRAGVMEIIPAETEGDSKGVKLEIILTVPAEVNPVQQGNTLTLSFNNPEAEEFAAPSPEGVLRDARYIEGIELSKSRGKVHVVVRGDGQLSPDTFQPEKRKVVLDFPGVTTSAESPMTYEPPVVAVRVGKQPDKTRIVIDLSEPTLFDVSTEDNQFILSFAIPEAAMAEAEVPSPAVPETPALSAFGKVYTGEVISIDIQDAPLSKIFAILAEVSGFNIILSPQVKEQRIFIKLDNVPWDQALDVILRNYGLSKSVEGNIIRVAPTAVIAQEEEQIARAKEAALKAGDLETKMYAIDFADVNDLKRQIEDIMEEKGAGAGRERGTVSIDKRTNTLIIRDVANMHVEYERVIQELDTPTRQVAIEAKLVSVSRQFTQELGIQWGVLWKPTPQTTIGGSTLTEGTGLSGNPLMINMPAAVAAGTGGALGFGYIGAENLRSLDLQLSAMESSGKGKTISNPKIITLDNQEATIETGQKIPYQTVSAEGTQTQFVNATLELKVTPHITPHGTVVMDLELKNDQADFSQQVQGVPTINTNEAESQVLIKDGDTLVIGGIYTSSISKATDAVPLLGQVPILGWLFKKDKDTEEVDEALIFITPRIIR